MCWDCASFGGWKGEEDPAKEADKWPVREVENKREQCPEIQVEDGFKMEGVINCVKIA